MTMLRYFERMVAMNDGVWARHANPWSVWTRFTCLPLLALAIWSRVWLGWWSLLPIAVAVAWIWLNPRAFAPPIRTDNWASKGTLGERVYLNRDNVPIPHHHIQAARILTAMSALGALVLIYGLAALDLRAVVFGMTVGVGAKVWFVDRMVWLYQDMKDKSPAYAGWLRSS